MTLLQSRFAQASTAALIVLVLIGAARADTIKDFFIEDGTATNVSGGNLFGCLAGATCSFSGTMMVDVTSSATFPDGTVTAYDITFPGVAPFSCCSFQGPSFEGSGGWVTRSNDNIDGLTLRLNFTTTNFRSLVGFDGGSITEVPQSEVVITQSEGTPIYRSLSGSITPVPEPSSLALLGGGLLPMIGVIRRRYLNRQ